MPAPSRVEPATTSGGVGSKIGISDSVSSLVSGLFAIPIVVAPTSLAFFIITEG